MRLASHINLDPVTAEIAKAFDYAFDGNTITEIAPLPLLPNNYQIGLIVGPSGSGKTTLLNSIRKPVVISWDDTASVASHFGDPQTARDKLSATGLNSIPAWCRPYSTLSNGEKFRADLARQLTSGACIDEFTSVVDRNVAKSCSVAVSRYIHKNNLEKIVFASCHYDIAEWLQPDWIYDAATGVFTPRGGVRQIPVIKLDLLPCSPSAWYMFRQHHYLSAEINRASKCWIAVWNGTPVGFVSAIAFPNGNIKNAWREHRTVVLPDFQGLGLGVRISDAVGEIMLKNNCRYFSKTAHPRMGEYRENSPAWRPTSKNKKSRQDYKSGRKTKESSYKHRHADRITWSHEYIGFYESNMK